MGAYAILIFADKMILMKMRLQLVAYTFTTDPRWPFAKFDGMIANTLSVDFFSIWAVPVNLEKAGITAKFSLK